MAFRSKHPEAKHNYLGMVSPKSHPFDGILSTASLPPGDMTNRTDFLADYADNESPPSAVITREVSVIPVASQLMSHGGHSQQNLTGQKSSRDCKRIERDTAPEGILILATNVKVLRARLDKASVTPVFVYMQTKEQIEHYAWSTIILVSINV